MKLGEWNVEDEGGLLDRMSWRQFKRWRAYAELEPFDEERQDLRIASVVQALFNINRDRKKHPTPWTVMEFLLPFGDLAERTAKKTKPQQTWQEQKAIMRELAQAYGAVPQAPSAANAHFLAPAA